MTAKLELRNVTKTYGKTIVIRDLSLLVEEGEFFVILGPSGTGKSTLLKLIVGIEQPTSGRVLIDGKDVTALPPNKRNLAMVFQNYALYPNMNVFNNIAFPLKMHHSGNITQKVREVAEKLNISEILSKRVNQISGGQQQRVALARAMVRNPAMFLLDEPLSNLDARVRFSARSELKRLQQELKQSFVFVTHDQKEAEALGDRVAVLNQGEFQQIAPYKELYEDPANTWVGDFVGDFPMNFIDGKGFRPEWANVGVGPYSITVDSSESFGDIYYVFGRTKNDEHIVLKSAELLPMGYELKFSVTRFKEFENIQHSNATRFS